MSEENDLKNLNDSITQLISNLNDHIQVVTNESPNNNLKTEYVKYFSKTQASYQQMLQTIDGILKSRLHLQKYASKTSDNAVQYLNNSNEMLGELIDSTTGNVDELKIQENNRKRIVEMQRNRLAKFDFIKKSLLYILCFVFIIGLVLFVEKLLGKRNSALGSGLKILIGVISLIFLILRAIEYYSRSKFNFRQYDFSGGSNGEKYDKTIYEYDNDQLNAL